MTLDELLNHPVVLGVSLKGCIDGGPSAMKGVAAHAHWRKGRTQGWICLKSLRHLNCTTVTHELAHLVLESDSHGPTWQHMVRQLGGRVEQRYLGGKLGCVKRTTRLASRSAAGSSREKKVGKK